MHRDSSSIPYGSPVGITAVKRPNNFCAWRGPSILVVGADGWAGQEPLSGFFFRETRYLSVLKLEIQGDDPFPCSLAEVRAHRLESTYNYPPLAVGGGGGSGSGREHETKGILERGLDLKVIYEVHASSLEVQLILTNRWNELADFELAWLLDADFAGVLEAQNESRQQSGPVQRQPVPQGVKFVYGHPELPLESHISAAQGGDWRFVDGRLKARVQLCRQEVLHTALTIQCVDVLEPYDTTTAREREARLDRWYSSVARLQAPGETPLIAVTTQAIADVGSFALLEGPETEWLTPSAGVPLYLGLWGRDALTAVWQAAIFDCGEMAESSLDTMARLQGTNVDPSHDEQPGRIIQEARKGPLDRLGKTPFTRYFGDYASPFDFIFALAHAYTCRGDIGLLRRHWNTAIRILEWAKESGDLDGDGYLEYETQSKDGPRHQGWKDSNNAVVYEDGRAVDPPLASCEIQGYYFAAMQAMAIIAAICGEHRTALRFWRKATDFKKRFNRDFWMDDVGFVAFGLDSQKRQIRALTSNAGQCLATGIVDDDHIPRLVRRLFEPDLFSGWGIRTLSTENPAYNPLDYHLGSIWLVENATMIFGLRRFGYNERALELTRALYDLALLWPGYRVPECIGGYAREELAHPGAYPRANAPQLWNQSAWPLIMQCILGLQPFAPLNLLAVDPVLPAWLPEVTISNLRIGTAVAQIRFYREGKDSQFEVLNLEGDLKVIRQQPVGSLTAGTWNRLSALVKGMMAA